MDRPNFITRSPATVEAELIAAWETIAQKPLFPGQAERLLINLIAYREALLRMGIQYAAEQNLVNYAIGLNLDQLGELVATPRLPDVAATVTLQFTKAAASLATAIVIPAGTQVATASGIVFSTTAAITIASGTASGSATAICTTTGIAGNGFTNGQINQFFSVPIAGIQTVGNTSTSSGGADIETDDRYRTRIKLAPEQYSVAGSAGSYRYHTLKVNQTIVDVAVLQPIRGQVKVYPLTAAGQPSALLLTQIATALNADTVRPLTDDVEVLAPFVQNYFIQAQLTVLANADSVVVLAAANAAATAYVSEKRSRLGQDVMITQVIAALMVPGVYNVLLSSPGNTVVAANEFANCTGINITIAGVNEG